MLNSAKLKGRLRERGRTQSDLGEFLGIATATVCQKLNGVRPLNVEEAEKIALFLEIPDSEFGAYFFNRKSA